MTVPSEFSFLRYLAAKKGVDDRSLNRGVWERFALEAAARQRAGPIRVLEVGCGLGTMLERLLETGVLTQAPGRHPRPHRDSRFIRFFTENRKPKTGNLFHTKYTGIDLEPELIAEARARLGRLAGTLGGSLASRGGHLVFQSPGQHVEVELEAIDLFHFIPREQGRRWDLLLAHAFLDLVDLSATLPGLLALLDSRGLCYFTLNFDGATIFEPTLDPKLDPQIERLYNRTMDERRINDRPSGDSLTGRRLLGRLKAMGVKILAAGSSDWVVFAGDNGYAEDEAYLLHFIIHTVGQALQGHPEIGPDRLEDWLKERHSQIIRGELIYIAHQLDVLGQV